MTLQIVTAWIMLIALLLYVLLGGADFGAGVWDMLATGDAAQRRQIRIRLGDAITPVWEANHIWLILIIVLMFNCFPRAFAGLMVALHVPITLVLLGIIVRGSMFVFRKYTPMQDLTARRRYGRTFSIASLLTPILLGVSLGTAASGQLHWDDAGVYTSGFIAPWLYHIFPWSVGLLTLAIFAFLAATYLCVEFSGDGDDRKFREMFRTRAIGAEFAVIVMAVLTWVLAYSGGASLLSQRLSHQWWSLPLQIVTGLATATVLFCLWNRLFFAARFFAGMQITLVVVGYGAALFPYLIVPQYTLDNSAGPKETFVLVLSALGAGAFILLPSLYYLFRVFKMHGSTRPST